MHSWLTSKRIYCINLFLSKRLVCDIPFSSCSFSILPDFASELFMLHLALLVAVALCLSLTSDTCSDLVNSCRLRELWDSFGGCEAPFLPGISSLSLSLFIPRTFFLFFSLSKSQLSFSFDDFVLSQLIFEYLHVSSFPSLHHSLPVYALPFPSLCIGHSSTTMLHFSTPLFALHFHLFFTNASFFFLSSLLPSPWDNIVDLLSNSYLSWKMVLSYNYTESYFAGKVCLLFCNLRLEIHGCGEAALFEFHIKDWLIGSKAPLKTRIWYLVGI